MVQSKLDNSINYEENKRLEQDDKNYEATLYEVNVLGKNIIIGLGKAKYTYIEKNIEYFPIYFIKNKRVQMCIGIYEILSNQTLNILDEDGDIDIDKLNNPLLFSFVK